jgi:tRNA pseudouridine55 synthase
MTLAHWLFLDKPVGLSSNQALQKVRRLYSQDMVGKCKAGYVGTLDPLATGFLPIALGEATKAIHLLDNAVKTYHFTVRWGQATNTGDAEGVIISEKNIFPNENSIINALVNLIGEQNQIPPCYSSIKQQGIPAYQRARAGDMTPLPPRRIAIFNLSLTGRPTRYNASFVVVCSKGTYVRVLAETLAETLGAKAHLVQLRRLAVGNVNPPLVKLEHLQSSTQQQRLALVQPLETMLDDILAYSVGSKEVADLQQGKAISIALTDCPNVLIKHNSVPIAFGRVADGLCMPFRVFNC